MEAEDIVYLFLLIFGILFGYIYRQIEDQNTKKWIGTLVGFLIILVVSGLHILHTLITILVNIGIILYTDKRKCHLVSFGFTFMYLFFFRTTEYFGIPYPPGHTNMVQMILTLRLVGLAFEVNLAHVLKKKSDSGQKTDEEKLEEETNDFKLSPIEILHYSLNYVGILTGPYIRYRTFKDYFELPFPNHIDWKKATIDKLKLVPLFAALFLLSSHYWPLSYAKTDEFYNDRSLLYRLWYIWPNFFIFRMRVYTGLILSECICTMACFGAYPDFTEPKTGHGPSRNFSELKQIAKDEDRLRTASYSFETVHNVNPMGAEFCPTFRESMKHWNMCIQYWLAVNIYKRFPHKKYRTIVTMLVSAVWHGVYTGYYVCLGGAPFVLPIEDVWVKLLLKDNSGISLKICEWFMVVFKMFFFSYLSIAFHLLSLNWIIHYYNSIYHMGIIIGVGAYYLGLQLLKIKRRRNKDSLNGTSTTTSQDIKAD